MPIVSSPAATVCTAQPFRYSASTIVVKITCIKIDPFPRSSPSPSLPLSLPPSLSLSLSLSLPLSLPLPPSLRRLPLLSLSIKLV